MANFGGRTSGLLTPRVVVPSTGTLGLGAGVLGAPREERPVETGKTDQRSIAQWAVDTAKAAHQAPPTPQEQKQKSFEDFILELLSGGDADTEQSTAPAPETPVQEEVAPEQGQPKSQTSPGDASNALRVLEEIQKNLYRMNPLNVATVIPKYVVNNTDPSSPGARWLSDLDKSGAPGTAADVVSHLNPLNVAATIPKYVVNNTDSTSPGARWLSNLDKSGAPGTAADVISYLNPLNVAATIPKYVVNNTDSTSPGARWLSDLEKSGVPDAVADVVSRLNPLDVAATIPKYVVNNTDSTSPGARWLNDLEESGVPGTVADVVSQLNPLDVAATIPKYLVNNTDPSSPAMEALGSPMNPLAPIVNFFRGLLAEVQPGNSPAERTTPVERTAPVEGVAPDEKAAPGEKVAPGEKAPLVDVDRNGQESLAEKANVAARGTADYETWDGPSMDLEYASKKPLTPYDYRLTSKEADLLYDRSGALGLGGRDNDRPVVETDENLVGRRLTRDQWNALSDDQRQAVRANGLLVKAREKDLADTTPLSGAALKRYEADVDRLFGPGGGSEIQAPRTVEMLDKAGVSLQGQDLDEYLSLERAIDSRELGSFTQTDAPAIIEPDRELGTRKFNNYGDLRSAQNMEAIDQSVISGIEQAVREGLASDRPGWNEFTNIVSPKQSRFEDRPDSVPYGYKRNKFLESRFDKGMNSWYKEVWTSLLDSSNKMSRSALEKNMAYYEFSPEERQNFYDWVLARTQLEDEYQVARGDGARTGQQIRDILEIGN